MIDNYFASCPRGLEAALADELTALEASDLQVLPGGVSFAGDRRVCYRANLESRLASRILKHVATGAYSDEADIYRLALAVPWPEWFAVDRTIKVSTTAVRSSLRSLDFVTLRVKDAVCDRFRTDCRHRPTVDTRDPTIRIQVFLNEGECIFYLDTSGKPLWQRGLRQKSVLAPLKENLAAGILRLTGWDGTAPLFDPMCGSGTFLSEAAQIARNSAPGKKRAFAFESMQDFDGALWQQLKAAALAREKTDGEALIYGCDCSAAAMRATLANLDRAGLLPSVKLLEAADLTDLQTAPADDGIMVCNPPYGERMEDREALSILYPQLGQVLKHKFAGWTCYILSAEMQLQQRVRLKASRRILLFNGAIECRLFEFKMVTGSNRRARAPV